MGVPAAEVVGAVRTALSRKEPTRALATAPVALVDLSLVALAVFTTQV
jgi:hypothetical protein